MRVVRLSPPRGDRVPTGRGSSVRRQLPTTSAVASAWKRMSSTRSTPKRSPICSDDGVEQRAG